MKSTRCQKGHPYSTFLYLDPRGRRQCRECRRLALRRYYDKWWKVSPDEKLERKRKRFLKKVFYDKSGCWLYTGPLDQDGYGRYRTAWMLWVGVPHAWPQSLDHLCRNRACVNPEHLQLVPISENIRRGMTADAEWREQNAKRLSETIASRPAWRDRLSEFQNKKTSCPAGHPYSGKNLILEKRTGGGTARRCRICSAEKTRRYQSRKV